MSFKSSFKGWLGELQSIVAKKLFLNSVDYIDINNVTLPTARGTTQIDHVIVSRHGVFVVESKNMSGWIFGDEAGKEWTQILSGQRFKFQNPLRQNYHHTRALSDLIAIDQSKIFPVIMFWGNCQLRTRMPPNVLTADYTDYIKSKRHVLFEDGDVKRIVATIKEGMLPKTWATRRQHITHLKERFSSTSLCPKCGSPLALRIAKVGRNAGSQFYGCTRYPACRYIRNVPFTRAKPIVGDPHGVDTVSGHSGAHQIVAIRCETTESRE